MSGIFTGLVLWAYALAGLVVVPIAMAILVTVLAKPRSAAFGIAAAGWYLGAPVVFFICGATLNWLNEIEGRRIRGEYLSLCREFSAESISRVIPNVEWLKLDVVEVEIRNASSLYATFGSGFDEKLFGRPGREPYKNWGKYKNVDAFRPQHEAPLVVRVRTKDHIPYVGTFYAMEISIELVDPATKSVFARRRTFTNNPHYAVSTDCDGKNLHDTNLDFLQRAAAPISSTSQ